MKRFAVITTVVLSTLAILLLLWQLRSVVLTFFFSLALAWAINGPVTFLIQRGWSRGLAVITSFVAVFGGLILFFLLVTLPLIDEIDPLARNLILEYHRLQDALLRLSGSQPSLATRLPSTAQLAAWWSSGANGVFLSSLMGITQSIGFLISHFLLSLVISIYWMLDQMRFERLWLSLLSPEHRTWARDTWRKIESNVGAYLRSEFVQFLLSALLLAPGFWLLDIKQPILLALFVALAWLVPLIGLLFAIVGAALIGWLTGLDVAIATTVYTIIILAVLEYYLEPRLYRQERYWNVLVVLVMLVLGDALGLVGLLLAPPTAVAIQILLNSLLDNEAVAPALAPVTTVAVTTTLTTAVPPATTHRITGATTALPPDFSTVLTRLESIRNQLKNSQAGGSLRANNLFTRLNRLVNEVEEATASASIQ